MVKEYVVTIEGVSYGVTVERKYGSRPASSGQSSAPVRPAPAPAPAPVPVPAPAPAPASTAPDGAQTIQSPMNGTILSVKVQNGQSVKKGDVLFTIEAMKMENEIMSPIDGVVTGVSVSEGASVESGTQLCSVG